MARRTPAYRSVAPLLSILLACPAASVCFRLSIATAGAAHRPGTSAGRPGCDRAWPARAARSAVVRSPGPGDDPLYRQGTAPPQAAP